jgi:hypothetical protein
MVDGNLSSPVGISTQQIPKYYITKDRCYSAGEEIINNTNGDLSDKNDWKITHKEFYCVKLDY